MRTWPEILWKYGPKSNFYEKNDVNSEFHGKVTRNCLEKKCE